MRTTPTLLCSLALLAALAIAWTTATPSAADENAATDAILELTVDVLPSGLDQAALTKQVGAVDAALAKLEGFVSTESAVLPSGPKSPKARLLRTTIWRCVEDAEAASLAMDGNEAEGALVALTESGSRRVFHYRNLRSANYSGAATGHLEVTIYRTRVGTTREANLERFDRAETDFGNADGILGHSTWIAPNGKWVHLVRWRSEADFNRTGKGLMKTKGVGGWIRSLDFQRFTVLKGDPVRAR